MELKKHYPRLVVNNKALLTIYAFGGIFTKAYFESREEAEKAVFTIGERFGKTPLHDIRDC